MYSLSLCIEPYCSWYHMLMTSPLSTTSLFTHYNTTLPHNDVIPIWEAPGARLSLPCSSSWLWCRAWSPRPWQSMPPTQTSSLEEDRAPRTELKMLQRNTVRINYFNHTTMDITQSYISCREGDCWGRKANFVVWSLLKLVGWEKNFKQKLSHRKCCLLPVYTCFV